MEIEKLYKVTLIVLFSFIYTQSLLSQTTDLQWVVLNGDGKDSTLSAYTNNYVQQPLTGSISVDGVKLANAIITHSDFGTRNYENRFFAIFSDGSYSLTQEFYQSGDTPDEDDGNTYQLDLSGKTLNQLYLSNHYEEDDPPGRVVIDGNPSAPSYDKTITLTASNYNGQMLLNHNPATDKDFTLILDHLGNGECTLEYQVLEKGPNGKFQEITDYSGFSLDPSGFNVGDNIISGPTNSNSLVPSGCSFDNNREVQLTLDNTMNTFINFKPAFTDLSFVGRKLNFSLTCGEQTFGLVPEGLGSNSTITSGPHDPNYVRLECVWEEEKRYGFFGCKRKKIKKGMYKVYCYNESLTAGVANLQYTFELPQGAKPSNTYIVCDSIFGVKTIESNDYLKNNKLNVSGNLITYDFLGGLSSFPQPGVLTSNHIGNVTFVVEFDNTVDLRKDDLRLLNPVSHFITPTQTLPFPIYNFIDVEKKCYRCPRRDSIKTNNPVVWDCVRQLGQCPDSCN